MPFIFNRSRVLFLFSAVLMFRVAGAPARPAFSVEPEPRTAAVLVSRNIRPYLEAVQGFQETWRQFTGVEAQVFFLDQYDRKRRETLIQEIEGASFGAVVTVGPEAARFMRDDLAGFNGPGIYTMILNPVNILGDAPGYCGIDMGISATTQVLAFKSVLPVLKRIGLLYNAGQNQGFAESAAKACRIAGLQLVPLRVSDRKDIPGAMRDHWESIDALWMIPDHVIASESIIRYIIREGIARKIPVFGFNRFFYDNGAAIAFMVDYRQTGSKTATLTFDRINKAPCTDTVPAFRAWYNERIVKRAGLTVPEPQAVNIEAGP